MSRKTNLCLLIVVSLLASACNPNPGTAEPAKAPVAHEDGHLCFVVEPPVGWAPDHSPGGAMHLTHAGETQFSIVNVDLGQEPTLRKALANLKQGSLGSSIREVKDASVDGLPALWATLAAGAQFRHVVMVVAPDCGDGQHALFISTEEADPQRLETWLGFLRFATSSTGSS